MPRFLLILLCLPVLILQAAASQAATTITDADGVAITVARPYSRVISLYGAHTENLFSLGLDREIAGVADGDDFPAQAAARDRFSYREDAERVIAARPDLVLIRPMISRGYPGWVEKIRRAGIAVVSLQPVSADEMYDYWRTLGILTGREKEAEKMIEGFRSELARIGGKVAAIPKEKRRRVYFEAIHARMKTFAPASMAIFVLESAGGVNAAADAQAVRDTNIADYGKERILARAGEIDIFLAQTGRMNRVDVAMIRDEPGFAAIRAVRENRIFLIDEELVARPTPRLLDGIREIAAILYPDLFPAGERTKP